MKYVQFMASNVCRLFRYYILMMLLYSDYGKNRVGTLDECFEIQNLRRVSEIYINSIDKNGTGNGLDLDIGEILFKKAKTPFILAGYGKTRAHNNCIRERFYKCSKYCHLLNFIGNSLEIQMAFSKRYKSS